MNGPVTFVEFVDVDGLSKGPASRIMVGPSAEGRA